MTVAAPATKGVPAEVDELRKRFFDKLNREGTPDCVHAQDLERISTSSRYLLNFLENQDMNIVGALNMLWQTCEWRQSFGTNDLTENNVNQTYLRKDGLYFTQKHDIDGKILLVVRSDLHYRGMRDSDELMRVLIYWLERIWRTNKYDKFTIMFELTGCGLSHVDLNYTRSVLNIIRNYYPNSVNYLLIFDMPWILNAAFKVIKSFMPPKLVASLRFPSPKTLREFVPIECQLQRWGGVESNEYQFVSERRPSGVEIISNGAGDFRMDTPPKTPLSQAGGDELERKVHFANSLQQLTAADGGGIMSDASLSNGGSVSTFGGGGGDQNAEGIMLRLNPVEVIHFHKSGNEMVGNVEITNIVQIPVTYKIKTTSPDKFRVRPSTGVLAPGASTSINVMLLQGPNTLVKDKDKFLVMCMELDTDANTSTHDITELWRNTPTSSPDVEQHKLKCWPANANYSGAEIARNGGGVLSGLLNGQFSGPTSGRHLEATIAQLADTTSRLEAQLKFSQTLQWITLLVFLLLAVAIVYILKMEINTSAADYCVKRH